MDNTFRQKEHKKHLELESIFPELESILGSSEKSVLNKFKAPNKKVYLIVGCARSGSTLLYQYLAKTGYFVYPTNFLSRFYYAPYIGYRLQQALLDFDLKGEIFQKEEIENEFKSNLGKTKGPYAPHEFWYFWNRFFKFKNIQQLSKEEVVKVDWELFLKELQALEVASGKPILMKAMNLNWNLIDLKNKIPNVHFIYIKRDTLYNAQSLLVSRKNFFGNYKDWYSFKPPNYDKIKLLEAEAQVIEQVLSNNRSIESQLKEIESSNKTIVNYADFCNAPENLVRKLNDSGANINLDLNKEIFKSGDYQKVNDSMFRKLENYLNNMKVE